ncbi:hypothetical protein ATANTOWER_000780 [Ataeniobius toweri]|uniref:Uncharacterized protein n=1 Tax=Ataeniobius toweri TaxID=208326 RepID=A0ABU7C8C2_9TELE|nr:hypothetical protein [Ataeniobius toweri]
MEENQRKRGERKREQHKSTCLLLTSANSTEEFAYRRRDREVRGGSRLRGTGWNKAGSSRTETWRLPVGAHIEEGSLTGRTSPSSDGWMPSG